MFINGMVLISSYYYQIKMEHDTETLKEISERLERVAQMIEDMLERFFSTQNQQGQEEQENEQSKNNGERR